MASGTTRRAPRTALGAMSARLPGVVRRIERASVLDAPANAITRIVRRATRADAVKNALSGVTIGHRLHPVLTDVPIGAWLSASLLDVVGGRHARVPAQRLVGVGVLATLPTAATGLSDWADTHGRARRVGLVHLVVNSMGTALQLASWRARRRGKHLRGAVLSGAALGAVGAGGYLGGHLVYAQRTGVDAEVPVIESDGWHIAVRDSELLDGQPLGVDIEDGRVVLVRVDGAVYALASVCSHAGGPLEKGTVGHASIECPWHGSRFRLGDGSVERGPATTPAFAYAARVRNGTIEIRRTRRPSA